MELLLFDLAIHTGADLRALLALETADLTNIKVGNIIPHQSGKKKCILTNAAHYALINYCSKTASTADGYLFPSPSNANQPLSLADASKMIKSWFRAVGMKGNLGAPSLRRIWESRQENDISLETHLDALKRAERFPLTFAPPPQKTIFRELLDGIVTGKILPGSKLNASEISSTFQFSHKHVRVALNCLKTNGIVVHQGKNSIAVREFTEDEIRETQQIRLLLETEAAKSSYRFCTEDTLAMLAAIIEKIRIESSFEVRDSLNTQFHLTMYRDARQPLISELITELCDNARPYIFFYHASTGHGIPPYDRGITPLVDLYRGLLQGMRNRNIGEINQLLKIKLKRPMSGMQTLLKRYNQQRRARTY